MSKKYIALAISGKTATINIYSEIGESWSWDDTKTAGDLSVFADNFAEATAAGVELINVRISSPGGDIAHGLPIANLISQSAIPVHTYCDGMAYSMGAVILAAGHKVFAAENSKIMLHCASTYARGNVFDFAQEIEVLRGYDSTVAGIVAAKTGKTVEEILAAYFDGQDHYLTAQEAFEAGLIDEIVPARQESMLAKAAGKIAALFGQKQPEKFKKTIDVEAIISEYGAYCNQNNQNAPSKFNPVVAANAQTEEANFIAKIEAQSIEIEALKLAIAKLNAAPADYPSAVVGQSVAASGHNDFAALIDNLPHNKAADKFFKK